MIEVREARKTDVEEVMDTAKDYYSSEKDLRLRLEFAVSKAYVVKDELGRIGMMYGFYQIWPGVFEIWAVTTRFFDYRKIAYTRYIRGKINESLALDGVHRVQVYVKAKYPGLKKWAEALGFTLEGLHPKMGSDQEDYHSYGKVK